MNDLAYGFTDNNDENNNSDKMPEVLKNKV